MAIRSAARRAIARPLVKRSQGRAFSASPSAAADQPSRPNQTSSLVSSIEKDMNESTAVRNDQRGISPGLQNIMKTLAHTTERRQHMKTSEMNELNKKSQGMERLQTRNWKVGDVYSPRDLSPAEMKKWRNKGKPNRDVFDILDINPLDEWKNFPLLAEFMTSMGRIKHPRETGLRPVNQRKIAKAIRRAIGLGFHPSVHVHPELLRRDTPWEFH